jgi:hypothetical protein
MTKQTSANYASLLTPEILCQQEQAGWSPVETYREKYGGGPALLNFSSAYSNLPVHVSNTSTEYGVHTVSHVPLIFNPPLDPLITPPKSMAYRLLYTRCQKTR